jgi:DNA-binding response OmpR family regulator
MARRTPTILVVDDDPAIRTALERSLSLEGYAVTAVDGGRPALDHLRANPTDAVVLDLGLPDLDGVSVVRRLRASGHAVPICILSARDEVTDRVEGLRCGADDYLVKPFALAELVARLEALLRRKGDDAPVALRVGDLVVDPLRRTASLGERPLDLTQREFDLLETLTRNAGIVMARETLIERVWGWEVDVDFNAVDVFVGYLRRKLEANGEPRLIHTVRGIGFTLRLPGSEPAP